jgi:hypothetical protein
VCCTQRLVLISLKGNFSISAIKQILEEHILARWNHDNSKFLQVNIVIFLLTYALG